MEEATPPPPTKPPLLQPHKPKTLDDLLERCMGALCPSQLAQAVIVSLAWVFDAQQTFINVFADAAPAWTCADPFDPVCAHAPNPCALPPSSWSYSLPSRASTASDWSLACARGPAFLPGLPASSFFAGCLIGGLALATLADSSLGRKRSLSLSCLLMSIFSAATAAAPNVWVYSLVRFIVGFFRATIGTSALVLSTELVGKKWRGEVGILGFVCFTVGFSSLPALAYYNRYSSWRLLYLYTSLPALIYSLCVHFFVRESPRWLLVRGRKEEALDALKSITSSPLTSSFSSVCGNGDNDIDVYSALKALCAKRWALRRLTGVMMAGFGIGMVYYGMPLGVGDLGFNLYASVTFNALAELPSALITLFLIGRLNRRTSVLACTASCAVLSVACAVEGGGGSGAAKMGAEVGAFFCACTAFNVLLIYALELFPTCVRNSAVAMVRQALVLGGVFAPALVAAGRRSGRGWVSFGVFGAVVGFCGLFVAWLPETRGGGICDTLEEEEYRDGVGKGGDLEQPLLA
ncbi:Organic cation/carnitine transporter 3 [Acorus gramineus]|uniref:H(+)/Pi cotransporter n=1 Tax=Acorus gramineus TaxID=55184 RepID=A0AAV9BS97_ACOGR|nr:Organic cation/carnitine transporter 3 [Acorus gramineus]